MYRLILCTALLALLGCRDNTVVDDSTALPDAAPRQIVDDLKRTVTVPASPSRIVAASPYAVEMLYAIGVEPVARPEIADDQIRPAAARELPVVVMDHGTGPNMEQLAGLQGDMILTSPSFAPFAPTISESLQTPVVIYSIRDVADIPRVYRALGDLLDRASEAERAATAFEAELQAIRDRHADGDGPTVFAMFGAGDSYYTFLPDSYLGSMVEALGGRLVSNGVQSVRPGGTMGVFSLELVVQRQPDIILVARHGGDFDPAAGMSDKAVWAALPAVKNGRVHRISEWQYLTSPGPSAIEAMTALEALLYPEATSGE